ncbi:hypothetical protein VB618_08500 [Microvirga sp. CF3062]|uniref:hypothetical protein n=1 Tax=Microvirga sp. CF3062 TaxID=3110182 RepID=UPI002E799649|nr:hypothetical protein [Microvirga sp. CF3062]MEE1656234.1 hypothetical protein [Microvirga sp. CF3062]
MLLRAYQKQEAKLLAPIGYLWILFSGLTGWLFFAEVPTLSLCIGAGVVVLTTILVTPIERWFESRRAL